VLRELIRGTARTYVTLFVTAVSITLCILLVTVLYLGVMYGWKNTLEALPPRDMKELREIEDLIAALVWGPGLCAAMYLFDRTVRLGYEWLRRRF
jgi:hypothetical protein